MRSSPLGSLRSLIAMHVPAVLFSAIGLAVAYLLYARRWRFPFRRQQAGRGHVRLPSVGDIVPVSTSPSPSGCGNLVPNIVVSLLNFVGFVLGVVIHAVAVLGTVLLTPILLFHKKRRMNSWRIQDYASPPSGWNSGPEWFASAASSPGSHSLGDRTSEWKDDDDAFVLENLKPNIGIKLIPALFSSLVVPDIAVAARRIQRSLSTLNSRSYPSSLRRKTLILDLDETLIHSQCTIPRVWDFRLRVVIDRNPTLFHVSKRPYLDVFLRTAAMWYDLVIYTASLERYADPLISNLDPQGLVKKRLFRSNCRKHAGNFVKDIALVEPDLRNVIIVDNSPIAYSMHETNAIPIEPWYDDQKDEELLNLLPLLHAIAVMQDVRSLLSLRLTKGVLAARSSMRRSSLPPCSSTKRSDC